MEEITKSVLAEEILKRLVSRISAPSPAFPPCSLRRPRLRRSPFANRSIWLLAGGESLNHVLRGCIGLRSLTLNCLRLSVAAVRGVIGPHLLELHLLRVLTLEMADLDSPVVFQANLTVTALNPVADPEVHPTPHSPNLGAKQDVCALKMPYLLNQEGLNHETNFHGFYTQEEVHHSLNFKKRPTEKEVMNFTSQRFSSPFICEHHSTLEGVSSPKKERPEPKPIIKVKRSLLSFQEAQDHEKGSSKPGDMINFPKPVKSVLHLPQLEANRFNQLQTRQWRPGDHFNQSGGIPEVLSYTKTQEISWFNEDSLKSNRSYLWKDWTIFRFDPFQAVPIRPEDINTKPRRPGDIIGVQEEFYKSLSCTNPHRNKKILIYTKLPYLEILAIQLQQLFFSELMDEISTYPAPRKIPRKLSYPLKPSRFKQEEVSHLEPRIPLNAPTASFRFLALF